MQKQKISRGEIAYYKTRARQTKVKTFLRNWAIIGICALVLGALSFFNF
jgi:hypothetical protein